MTTSLLKENEFLSDSVTERRKTGLCWEYRRMKRSKATQRDAKQSLLTNTKKMHKVHQYCTPPSIQKQLPLLSEWYQSQSLPIQKKQPIVLTIEISNSCASQPCSRKIHGLGQNCLGAIPQLLMNQKLVNPSRIPHFSGTGDKIKALGSWRSDLHSVS